MKKSTLIFSILLLLASFLAASFANEKLTNKRDGDSCCKVYSLEKMEKPDLQCFDCGPKLCNATRATWTQLYWKIMKLEDKRNTTK